MKKQISPSMMCVDFMNVGADLAIMEKHGIEYLHIDIMDGHFVPNLSFSPDTIGALRKKSKKKSLQKNN